MAYGTIKVDNLVSTNGNVDLTAIAGLTEAPQDGKDYVRKDGAWRELRLANRDLGIGGIDTEATASTTWTLAQRLTGDQTGNAGYFGQAVDVSPDGTIVAAAGYGNPDLTRSDFRIWNWKNGTSWELTYAETYDTATSNPDDSGLGQLEAYHLGRYNSVGVAKDRVFIGDMHAHDGTTIRVGAIDVFDWNGRTWVQQPSSITGKHASQHVGGAIKVSGDGNTLVTSAQVTDAGATAAYTLQVYRYNGSSWALSHEWVPAPATSQRYYIGSLSHDGTRMVLALWDSSSSSGHLEVYEYNNRTDSWSQLGADLTYDSSLTGANSYPQISGDGNRVLYKVDSTNVRAVYEFDNAAGTWSKVHNTNLAITSGFSRLSFDGTVVMSAYSGTDQVGTFEVAVDNGSSWAVGNTWTGSAGSDAVNSQAAYNDGWGMSADGGVAVIGRRLFETRGAVDIVIAG